MKGREHGRLRRVGPGLRGDEPDRVPGRSNLGRLPTLAVVIASVVVAGCGDAFEQLLGPVPLEPTTVELVDFRTGPLQEASAFDILSRRGVRVDQTVGWDFLFFLTEAGVAEVRPFQAVTGELSEAGVQLVSGSFESLELAPEEGYVRTQPVTVEEGDVLALVSRRDPSFGGLRCRRYAKIEVLSIDVAAGILTFHHLVNPNCEVRGLVPGETGSLDE